MGDFLIVASMARIIIEFFNILSFKDMVQRLRRPVEFMGWSVKLSKEDRIKVNQPKLLQANIRNALMKDDKGQHKAYTYDMQLYPPTEQDNPLQEVAETYLQLVKDLRYLEENTRPDLE